MNFLVIATTVMVTAFVSALNEQEAKELRCLNLQSNPAVDMKWVNSVEKWYYPIWSRLDFYRGVADLLKVPVHEVSADVLTKPCLTSDKNFVFSGLGHKAQLNVTFDAKGMIHAKGNSYPLSSISVFGPTDNKNFVIGIVCWEDNEAAYNVWTTRPHPLPRSVTYGIAVYLEQLGFHSKNFLEMSCYSEEPPRHYNQFHH